MQSQQHPELFVQPLILSIKVASSTWKAWEAMPELGDGERPCHCHRGQLQAHAQGGRGCRLCGNCCWRVEAEARLCSSNEPCSGGSDWRVGNQSPPGLSVARTASLLLVTRCRPCSPPGPLPWSLHPHPWRGVTPPPLQLPRLLPVCPPPVLRVLSKHNRLHLVTSPLTILMGSWGPQPSSPTYQA